VTERVALRLPQSLAAWPSERFSGVLKQELEALGSHALPLQAGLTSSSYVAGDRCEIMTISAREEPGRLCVKVGVFYAGITAGCNCAGDPSAVEPQSEYCEVELTIDRETAAATARLVQD
jgi:hypothetical protein